MTDRDMIRLCIDRCRRAKDRRGPWQAERACVVALDGGYRELFDATGIVFASSIDFNCAAAARRIGEWLRAL